ncbi:peptidoglycan recognition protein family protein [Alkalicoccus urumqiensis]|nr:N-acetylmuramoyl-L-alanine amidase [Alkalicoccus urumqiensis]
MRIVNISASLARHAEKTYKKGGKPNRITIHHSAVNSGNARAYARYHVGKGWPGIGYHFVITPDGTIQQCWDVSTITFHTGGANRGNIGICLDGNAAFTSEQHAAWKNLCRVLCMRYHIPENNVRGHREWPGQRTGCPGFTPSFKLMLRNGDRGEEVTLLQRSLIQSGTALSVFGADGVFGKETERAVKQFQRTTGLQVDGLCGPRTLAALWS